MIGSMTRIATTGVNGIAHSVHNCESGPAASEVINENQDVGFHTFGVEAFGDWQGRLTAAQQYRALLSKHSVFTAICTGQSQKRKPHGTLRGTGSAAGVALVRQEGE